jgi:hypothetical protein
MAEINLETSSKILEIFGFLSESKCLTPRTQAQEKAQEKGSG